MGSGAEPQPKSNFVHFYLQNLTANSNDSNDLPAKLWQTCLLKQSAYFDCGTNRKRAYDFLLDLNSNLGPILPRFRGIRAFLRQRPLFRYPSSIRAKISGCSPWNRSVMLGSVESEYPKLTNREIIFQDFQPMWSGYQTDGRNTCRSKCWVPRSAKHLAV